MSATSGARAGHTAPVVSRRSSAAPTGRDVSRSAVYAAEDQVASLLARGGTVEVMGSTLTLPIERRFADIASIQAYADAVLALRPVAACWPGARPVRVRARAGSARAHYEPANGIIAIPIDRRGAWACRELIVLHELAHHLCSAAGRGGGSHGPAFADAMCRLTGIVIGPEAEFCLRVHYDGAGVAVAGGSP